MGAEREAGRDGQMDGGAGAMPRTRAKERWRPLAGRGAEGASAEPAGRAGHRGAGGGGQGGPRGAAPLSGVIFHLGRLIFVPGEDNE